MGWKEIMMERSNGRSSYSDVSETKKLLSEAKVLLAETIDILEEACSIMHEESSSVRRSWKIEEQK